MSASRWSDWEDRRDAEAELDRVLRERLPELARRWFGVEQCLRLRSVESADADRSAAVPVTEQSIERS